jgi:glycogen synthase
MRILLLSNLYPPHVEGGAEILARDIAGGLEKLGHEVLVLTSWFGLPKAQQDSQVWRTLRTVMSAHFDQRRSIWQQFSKLSNYYQDYHNAANAQELQRVIAATRPDALYIWEVNGIGINSLLSVLPTLTIPIVFHLGSYWFPYALSPETEQSNLRLRWFKQLLIGRVPSLTYTSLIAVSETVKQKYIEVGCDPQRFEVIYNGIDTRFFDLPRRQREEEASHNKQLLYVGRLRAEKGILVILKALDILVNDRQRTGLHLNIFGDGDEVYINELQAFIQEKRLAGAVTFHGKVPQDELLAYYDRSHLMLVPSLWQEPFGLVIAEAMARGLPVIASAVGGPAEIITHEVDGLLVAPGDEHALVSAISRLLENANECQHLSEAALITVRNRFTIEANAKRVEKHLLHAIHDEIANSGMVGVGITYAR